MRCPRRIGEPPFAGEIQPAQQHVSGKVVRRRGHAVSRKIGWTGAGPQRDVAELARDQVGVRERADADRDVHLLAHEIDDAILGIKHDAHVRVARESRIGFARLTTRTEGGQLVPSMSPDVAAIAAIAAISPTPRALRHDGGTLYGAATLLLHNNHANAQGFFSPAALGSK